jgi:hypothetical protein
MSIFIGLIDSGRIRTREELKRLYRRMVKKYHPDSHPESLSIVDFDGLRREYREAELYLLEAGGQPRAKPLVPAAPASAPNQQFSWNKERFFDELRDLVARGLPVNAKALSRNAAYRRSRDYVADCLDFLYGKAFTFEMLDEELRALSREHRRVHYYAKQVLWNSFDKHAQAFPNSERAARTWLDLSREPLEKLGLGALHRFLADLVADMDGPLAGPRAPSRVGP